MAITAFTKPLNGLWPLGQVTVATPGTPISMNVNVGAETQGTPGNRPNIDVQQLILTTPANTGLVYIIRKVVGGSPSKATPNFVVAVLPPSSQLKLGEANVIKGTINVDDYLIDADTAANSVYVSAYVG